LVTSTFHICPGYTKDGKEKLVMDFLSKHYSHNLRLIHRDDELDSVSDYYNAYREYCPVERSTPTTNETPSKPGEGEML